MSPELPAGCAAALFCIGSCFHRREAITELEILVDGVRHRPTAFGMPRPDVVASQLEQKHLHNNSDLPVDLRRSYRSGFWATIPFAGRRDPGTVELSVVGRLAGGGEFRSHLGSIEIRESEASLPSAKESDGLIAVCMATFEPDIRLFRTQIESLRAQSDRQWICLISDDCSSLERFEQIVRLVEGDPRFVVSRASSRVGFYRNFERALTMIPAEAGLVALSDQDDRWYPDKLQVLREALGTAQLVYSDHRLIDAEGKLLRDTFWKGRRNNYRNLASEVIVNTIGGAAMLFRRDMLRVALPFPEAPGYLFHDHWLGLVAMASGEVAFVDRPLYDYVQHHGAVFGDVSQGSRGSASLVKGVLSGLKLRSWRGCFDRWRAAYFYGYVAREVLAQTLLVRCPERLTVHKRRVLRRFVSTATSPLAFSWLAVRPLRSLLGRNETLGSEADLVRGIIWRWLIVARTRRAEAGGRMTCDAALPDPATFEQRRLRRWRARL